MFVEKLRMKEIEPVEAEVTDPQLCSEIHLTHRIQDCFAISPTNNVFYIFQLEYYLCMEHGNFDFVY